MKKVLAVISFLAIALPVFAQTQMFNSCVENEGDGLPVTLPTTFNTANTALPDPFLMMSGTRMTTKEQWAQRRQETLRLLERTVYGVKPPKPASVTGTVTNSQITVNVSENGRNASFTATVSLPSGTGPHPAIIRFGNSGADASNLGGGIATINFNNSSVGLEAQNARTPRSGAFYTIYGNNSRAGLLVAWAWGVSRIIDVIEQSGSTIIKPDAIAVTGCSRLGKGAFVAGVLDQRVALTIPMESGTGGTNIMRGAFADRDQSGGTNGAQSPSSAYGETYWLGDDFQPFTTNPNNLPVDIHQAIALVAPRGFFVMDKTAASAGQWLGIPSSHRAALAGVKVYEALGVGGNFHYMNTPTQMHCSGQASYNNELRDFADKFLHRNKAVGTTPFFTATAAPSMTNPNYMPWTTPTLSGNLTMGGCGPAPSGFTLETTVTPAANAGTINLSPARPANGRYEEGATVTVTQTPGANWEFTGWSGACTGTGACAITMSQNRTVTAAYKRPDGFIDTTNLIKNGTFTNTQNWTLNTWSGSATFGVSGGNANITAITSASTAANHSIQLVQNGIPLTMGQTYKLTFDASAASARTIGIVVEMDVDPWTPYMTPQTISLTSTRQTFEYTFTMTNPSDENGRVSFNIGGATQNVQISNAKLVQTANLTSIHSVSAMETNRTARLRTAVSGNAINVSFSAADNGMTTINMYDFRGKKVSSQNIKTVAGTNYTHTFNTVKMPNGIYMIEKRDSRSTERARVSVSR